MTYSTLQERSDYRRRYRDELRESGGRRIDLCIDGSMSRRLAVLLREYGYDTHPGSAISAFLRDALDEADIPLRPD